MAMYSPDCMTWYVADFFLCFLLHGISWSEAAGLSTPEMKILCGQHCKLDATNLLHAAAIV